MLDGDVVVWACGAWLPKLFPDHVPVRPVLAELFFLDGGDAWRDPAIPAFVDLDAMFYGTHDLDGLGVKMAPDFDGPPLDADAPLPAAGAARERVTREALAVRFPALADAPLIGSKTCRYEMSIDSHFIAAPHPGQRASGSWAAAPATGSSTGRRWPSASRRPCAARARCPRTWGWATASRATRCGRSPPGSSARARE